MMLMKLYILTLDFTPMLHKIFTLPSLTFLLLTDTPQSAHRLLHYDDAQLSGIIPHVYTYLLLHGTMPIPARVHK